MTSPTQRSLKLLADEGWTVAIVEHFNAHVRRRFDLFGFADLLAMKPGEIPLLIQVTSGANAAARIAKILEEPRAHTALHSGFRIEVHGWRKIKKKRGGKAMIWAPRIVNVEAGSCPTKLSDMPLPPEV